VGKFTVEEITGMSFVELLEAIEQLGQQRDDIEETQDGSKTYSR
jgi:hypothetical protein